MLYLSILLYYDIYMLYEFDSASSGVGRLPVAFG